VRHRGVLLDVVRPEWELDPRAGPPLSDDVARHPRFEVFRFGQRAPDLGAVMVEMPLEPDAQVAVVA
jgi:hypothetical protein